MEKKPKRNKRCNLNLKSQEVWGGWGGRNRKQWEPKGEESKAQHRMVGCVREKRRGGQTGGSGSQGGMVEVTGNGPKQHAITSHNGFFYVFFLFVFYFIFFKNNHSLHQPPGTDFFCCFFFFRLGNAGPPEAASRSLKHWEQVEGLSGTTSTQGGWREWLSLPRFDELKRLFWLIPCLKHL